jgi:hypothetical protein
MPKSDLTDIDWNLLKWLGEEDFSQYGECYGKSLDRLIEANLAQVHSRGEHQTFIANDRSGNKGIMYCAVSLTEKGRAALEQALRDRQRTAKEGE